MFTLHLKTIQSKLAKKRRDATKLPDTSGSHLEWRKSFGTEEAPMNAVCMTSSSISHSFPLFAVTVMDEGRKLRSYSTIGKLAWLSYPRMHPAWAMMDEKEIFPSLINPNLYSENISLCYVINIKKQKGMEIQFQLWVDMDVYTWMLFWERRDVHYPPFSLLFPDSQSNKRTSERVQPSSV